MHHKSRISLYLLIIDAVQVIRDIIRSPESSQERKRKHFANVAISEVYLEAIPSVFLYQMLAVYIIAANNGSEMEALQLLTGGVSTTDEVLFDISFVLSLLSAAFGIAR